MKDVVTRQLQVERRTGKVRRPKTDVLPLCHSTNRIKQNLTSGLRQTTVRSFLSFSFTWLISNSKLLQVLWTSHHPSAVSALLMGGKQKWWAETTS